jgi:hypothetical protein
MGSHEGLYGLDLCMVWSWLVKEAETCRHIRRYIKSVVLDGDCCIIYYNMAKCINGPRKTRVACLFLIKQSVAKFK